MQSEIMAFQSSGETSFAKLAMEGIAGVIRFLTPLLELLLKIIGGVETAFNYVRKALMENITAMYESGNAAQFLSNVIGVLTGLGAIAPAVQYAVKYWASYWSHTKSGGCYFRNYQRLICMGEKNRHTKFIKRIYRKWFILFLKALRILRLIF
jgi:hypothetical protein